MSFPIVPVIDNVLHLIFFFIINQLGWWVLELSPMLLSFFVRCQEQAVKYIMDGPGPW